MTAKKHSIFDLRKTVLFCNGVFGALMTKKHSTLRVTRYVIAGFLI